MDLQNIEVDDVGESTNSYIKSHYMKYVVEYVLFFIITIYVIVAYRLDFRFVILPIIVGGGFYGYVFNKMEEEFTKEFGASIGFAYSSSASMDSVSGKIFSIGHGRSISLVLTGIHDGTSMRIFNYSYTVGSGKSSRDFDLTVFEAILPRPVPGIILNSQADYLSSYGMADFSYFDPHTHVKLEGDFNKYFSLSVPRGYEMEAYQIFTPDVMADLIDKASNMSFEFNGDRVYVYVMKTITNKLEMQKMFDFVDFLIPLFVRNASGVSMVCGQQS